MMFYLSAFIAISSCIAGVASQSKELEIPCDSKPTWNNSEIYGQFTYITSNSILSVSCANVPADVSFIIFQVHTHRRKIILYQDVIRPNTSFTGTNVGMYSKNDGARNHRFSISNNNNVTVKAYISVHGYNKTAPIPGGCNLVSPVETDPTMKVGLQANGTLISVSIDPARIIDNSKCGVENIANVTLEHKFYRMYMSEMNYTEEEYFDGLRNMLTVENIEKNGDELPIASMRIPSLLRLFSAYPHTGSVYAVIVKSPFGQAVYVPAISYGCYMGYGDETCPVLFDVLTQMIFAALIFTGLFICFFGHHFFKTEMFLMGLLAGSVITYIVLGQYKQLESLDMSSASLLSGLLMGAIWLLLWWFYGLPLLCVSLPLLGLGFLVASSLMFTMPDGFQLLTFDLSYWCLLCTVMVSVLLCISPATLQANILSCAVLGGFATVYPIDYYLGSNLRYIVVNVFRRATVPGFGNAYLATPFQWMDIVVLLTWQILIVTGYLVQKYRSVGRPPFPPPPRSRYLPVAQQSTWYIGNGPQRNPIVDERAPLLA